MWPALLEGDAVILKGEAVTRRGALVCGGHLEKSKQNSIHTSHDILILHRKVGEEKFL